MPLITTESTYVKYIVDSRGMYNAYTLSGSEKKVQKELMAYNTDIIKELYGGFGDTDKSSLYGFKVKQPNELNNHIMEQYYFPAYNTSYTIPNNAITGDTYTKEYVKTVWATNYGGVKLNTTVRKIISWDIKPSKTITKYVISIINGPSYNYDDSNYIYSGDEERGKIYISYYKCIQVVAYYSDNTSKILSFDDNDNPGFSIYVSYVYYEWEYDTSNQEYNTLNRDTLYTHLSSKEETHIGDTVISRTIFHRGDEDEIDQDEGDQYEQFKIIDEITQINGIPVEH